MRLLIKFQPNFELKYGNFNNYWIQGLIYKLILGSEFDKHNENKFKWFNFSNIFPKTDFKVNEEKNLIISSPNKDFINYLKEQLEKQETIKFGNYEAKIKELKAFKPKENLKNWWKTETPIILDIGKEINKRHLYWTPKLKEEKLKSFNYFFQRLKENSLKKIAFYYNEDFEKLKEKYPFIFTRFKFIKSVTVFLEKDNKKIRMAGTLWHLFPFELLKDKYLYLLYETGLGEKNSLGFGFINVKKEI
jgi:CRISPR-associated endoribonuclease Cas6